MHRTGECAKSPDVVGHFTTPGGAVTATYASLPNLAG